MSVQPAGLVEIQSRILDIRSRFEAPAMTSSTSSTVTSTTTAGTDFAATLAQLTGDAPLAGAALGVTGDAMAGGPRGVTGDAIVADARRYLGIPYVWGGSDPTTGFDCSGLVQHVYDDLGIDLPRGSRDQAQEGIEIPSLAQARPGDLVTFGVPANHIGIYIGDNRMIVAPHSGDVVKVQEVYETPSHIRRIIPTASTGGGATAATTPSATSGLSALSGSSSLAAPTGPATSSPAMTAAPPAYRSLFRQAAERYGISADLLAALAQTESSFRPAAVSGAGAQGLMQLMPATARGLGVDPMDPAQAVDGAARLLRSHLKSFGSTTLALAAYNAGPGAVTRYHGVPPYAETRAYVSKVLAAAGRRG